MIAARRPMVCEQPRLVNVDVELEPGGLGKALQEVSEEGTGRPAADDCDACTVFQRELTRRRLDEGGGDVMRTAFSYPMTRSRRVTMA